MTANPSHPTVEAIVWDADGVLFNTFDERGGFRWSKTIADDLGVNPRIFKHIFSAGWTEVLRGTRNTRTHIADALKASGCHVPAEDYISYWLAKDCDINWEIAAHLHPRHSFIGTNQDPLRATLIAELFCPLIRGVFASSSIGFLKCEEGFYRHIESALELPPHQLCLIDDTAENVEIARSFGWKTHHFSDAVRLNAFLAALEFSARG